MSSHRQRDRTRAEPATPAAGENSRHPLDWPAAKGAVEDVLQAMNTRLAHRRQRQSWRIAGATAAALLMIGFVAFRARQSLAPGPAPGASVAAVLTPERQLLPDGSVIERRGDVRMAIDFSAALRRIVLERGEAHFQVAHDPARPFVVRAGGVEFRAVGTAFTISLADESVEMFVTEGRVAVATAPESAGHAASLGAPRSADAERSVVVGPGPAEELVVDAHNHVRIEMAGPHPPPPAVRLVSESEMNRRLAWRAPKLEFSGTPLVEAIGMIHSHAAPGQKRRLVLAEPALAAVRISGILRADNIDVLLAVLEANYGITAEPRGETEIVLRRAR